jgi:UDP-N-acetylglucosamine acyltransferase
MAMLVAHDCVVGDHRIRQSATFAGHVTVEDWAVVGAFCPVHQYVRGNAPYIGGAASSPATLPFSNQRRS